MRVNVSNSPSYGPGPVSPPFPVSLLADSSGMWDYHFYAERYRSWAHSRGEDHPFHCWGTVPYVPNYQLCADYEEQTAHIQGVDGTPGHHPCHCWW